jgi:hypothetical protein
MLGHELIISLKSYLTISDAICCDCTRKNETDWKVCVDEECTQESYMVNIVNPDEAVFAEKGYVISVSSPIDFGWLCIEVLPTEESE